jgi:hypothetical protein
MEGSNITFQFILYHCAKKGEGTAWEEVDKLKKTLADKRDEPVGLLQDVIPADPANIEKLTPVLTDILLQFIERVS